ncbi:MAG TPA: polyprenyl synthetase family protein [Clostridiaceae bacterium]|nr:polyprenyl synthetase family protein [Clostridiaceae bacterium]
MMFNEKMDTWRQTVEATLNSHLPPDETTRYRRLTEAMRYSLLAGGKRIRPVLALACAAAIEQGSWWQDQGSQFTGTGGAYKPGQFVPRLAAAIEMIHTYSLIHDDLPCMDDDELRRGRPTNHMVFGEGVAVLAGDALLNTAYEMLFDIACEAGAAGARCGRTVAQLAGKNGMIGGQMIDIEIEGKPELADEELLQELQGLKTGALICCPLLGVAMLYETPALIVDLLREYGTLLGRAFQIQDDLLDVSADTETMGKTVGKDARDQKATYVTVLGVDGARQRLDELTTALYDCCERLSKAGLAVEFMSKLVDYLNARKY